MRLWPAFGVRQETLLFFWFAGLETSFCFLCFAVALDWSFTYILRKTARISPRFSRVGPLLLSNVCGRSPPWESRSSWFCRFQSIDCVFWCSFGKDLQTAQASKISRETLASLWWVTFAFCKFSEFCYWNFRKCCGLPTAEGPTTFGGLWWLQGCFHCENAVDCSNGFSSAFLKMYWGAICEFFVNSCHHASNIF